MLVHLGDVDNIVSLSWSKVLNIWSLAHLYLGCPSHTGHIRSMLCVSPQVRGAFFEMLCALCEFTPALVQAEAARLCPAVLLSIDDTEPVVLPPVWEAVLHVVSSIPVSLSLQCPHSSAFYCHHSNLYLKPRVMLTSNEVTVFFPMLKLPSMFIFLSLFVSGLLDSCKCQEGFLTKTLGSAERRWQRHG